MADKKTIGIIYRYDENWIGGTYYILNLISALTQLPAHQQPEVLLYVEQYKDFELVKTQTRYSHLHYRNDKSYFSNPLLRIVNKLTRFIFKRNLVNKRASADICFCFPNPSSDFFKDVKRKIYWVPDLQEKHFPEFFNTAEIEGRNQFYKNLTTNREEVVFSSNASENDFYHLFPNSGIIPHIIKFAVTHPAFDHISIEELRIKYKLPERYFICPNQFWVHKNHKAVIAAVSKLRSEGIEATIVFTGKEYDHRSPHYTENLKQSAAESGFPETYKFLGFIDRAEQLCLIKNSIALIQPSLSEGWSTVIEDAMSLGKWVICSDIAANKEQIKKNVSFFAPADATELAHIIKEFCMRDPEAEQENYNGRIRKFAEDFISLT